LSLIFSGFLDHIMQYKQKVHIFQVIQILIELLKCIFEKKTFLYFYDGSDRVYARAHAMTTSQEILFVTSAQIPNEIVH